MAQIVQEDGGEEERTEHAGVAVEESTPGGDSGLEAEPGIGEDEAPQPTSPSVQVWVEYGRDPGS